MAPDSHLVEDGDQVGCGIPARFGCHLMQELVNMGGGNIS